MKISDVVLLALGAAAVYGLIVVVTRKSGGTGQTYYAGVAAPASGGGISAQSVLDAFLRLVPSAQAASTGVRGPSGFTASEDAVIAGYNARAAAGAQVLTAEFAD
jgi:hypothetical protein